MTARIQDVAMRAGVSTATVSRALRGLPNVSTQTRHTVERVAAELGYVVSRTASNLATGRTSTVAVLAPYLGRWYFSSLVAAVEGELRLSEFDALVVGLATPGQRAPFEAMSLRGRVDGIVVLTTPLTGMELDGLRALSLPTVYVGASVAGAMSVRIDDVAVARLATEHLIELGHTRIAYVGGDPGEPLNFGAHADRRAGWSASMRQAGLEPEPRYDVVGHFTAQGGHSAATGLLAMDCPPTAVFAASDEMAFGVLAAARRSGLQVPQDLSVVGVDGHELSEVLGLTTVEQPVDRQGVLAARMVLSSVEGTPPRAHEHVVLPVELHLRGSTAAPRV